MDRRRIEAIRSLGDRLAEYIRRRDRKLFNELHFARGYHALRLALTKAARDGWSPDDEPLIAMDTWVAVFEEQDEMADIDWRLARDMLMIRVCEQLHRAGWFVANQDIVEEMEDSEAEQEAG